MRRGIALFAAVALLALAVPTQGHGHWLSIDAKPAPGGQTLPLGVNRINAENLANRGAGVNVAILDTGIDLTHPDLAANIAGGVNCSDGTSYQDQNGHGTHVAGIVAALDNGIGVVGVAPRVTLWAVRVLDATGTGEDVNIICGLDWVDARSPAHGGPITVVNMSAGGPGTDDGACGSVNGDLLHAAVCRVVADGVTVVVSAGNDRADLAGHVPAAYNEVLAATAFDDQNGQPCGATGSQHAGDDTISVLRNYATGSDLSHTIAAPEAVLSTILGGGYDWMTGTSMSAPHVAGVAALYIATHPGASPAAVRAALMAAGEPVNVNFHGECGQRGSSHTDPSGLHPEPVVRADGL